MDKSLLQELRARGPGIRREWITLLKAEPVGTPLGHPDTLAYLIDRTLGDVHALLAKPAPAGAEAAAAPVSYDAVRRECRCGRNPLLEYFLAGERALGEALIQAQASRPGDPAERRHADLQQLLMELRRLAQREIRAFCAVCQQKPAG